MRSSEYTFQERYIQSIRLVRQCWLHRQWSHCMRVSFIPENGPLSRRLCCLLAGKSPVLQGGLYTT